ncbi:hypothetical protein K438DRAFT_1747329 [Mycena galopus ATCC 62051]|nr:hypothetical protein K438DRAFT_1747329 [Mycena galopus ATCC 62051]
MPAAALQVPIGVEDEFNGVVDLVYWRATYNEAQKGCLHLNNIKQQCCDVLELAQEKHTEYTWNESRDLTRYAYFNTWSQSEEVGARRRHWGLKKGSISKLSRLTIHTTNKIQDGILVSPQCVKRNIMKGRTCVRKEGQNLAVLA